MSYEEIVDARLTVHTVRNHLAAAKRNPRDAREEIEEEPDS
jgi:hypothetical protein